MRVQLNHCETVTCEKRNPTVPNNFKNIISKESQELDFAFQNNLKIFQP